MPTPDIDTHVSAFVADLSVLIRKSALEAVHASLNGSSAPLAPKKRGRPPGKTPKTPKTTTSKRTAPKLGGKRDPQDLEALVARLLQYITGNPGRRIEEINKAIGVTTKELALPVKKLMAAKKITSKGQKRSTTYFPVTSEGLVQVKRGKKPEPETAN